MTNTNKKTSTSPKSPQNSSPDIAATASSSQALVVELQYNRTKQILGAVLRAAAGGFCLWKLGTLGQIIGCGLLVMAAFRARKVIQSYGHSSGTFRISPTKIEVPTGLCTGTILQLNKGGLEHSFFIRKEVPWTMMGPVLVVEANGQAYFFPRDWFSSDSEQLRVARALNQRLTPPAIRTL